MGAFGVVLPPGATVFRARTAIIAYLVGMLVTSAAALVPAYKAATVPPVAALRDTYTLAARSLRARAAAGATGAALGAVTVVGGLAGPGATGTALVGLGAMVLFLGVTALSPVLVRPVARVVGAGLPRLFGVTGRLGLRNVMRNPRRTATTASALMIGLALVSTFAIFGQSIKVSVHDTVANTLKADYFVTPLVPGQNFADTVVTQIAAQKGLVREVVGVQGGQLDVDGVTDKVLAADAAAAVDMFALTTASGNLDVGPGQIAMSAAKAAALRLSIGAKVRVVYPQSGGGTLTLVGTFNGGDSLVTYLVSKAQWLQEVPDDSDAMALVRSAPGADPVAVRARLDALTKPYPNVAVYDQAGYIAQQEKTVDQLIGLVYVLLALAVVIALFGIVNTLALSVTERTKEIGMLRAIGLRRDQMWIIVVLESVVIAVFGATLGVGVGSFLGWALVSALRNQGISSFAYPVTTIVGVLVLGGVLGVLAAVFPALRAARMNVLRAIAAA
jgi:putative ABC transport system permease protein